MQHLGAVANDAAALLLDAREKTRYVDQSNQGNIEDVACADETRDLVGRVDVQRAGHDHRLVSDDADHDPRYTGESDDGIARKAAMYFQ